MSVVVPFPEQAPSGYDPIDNDPPFDPERHLALQTPEEIVMLTDLGYCPDEIATKATPVAASSPFRLLSDEGAEIMLDIARSLRSYARPAAERIENTVRGGCYQSRWLRDLATSPDVTDHLSAIYGIPVAPHPMPLHLGHMNFEPTDFSKAIDKWHHDTLPLDYVMTVTDPATVAGGRFEYFEGTKHEAAEFAARGESIPSGRTVAPDFPGPGYAIALHGHMVVHRAAALTAPCERISMVNGYVATDTSLDEQSRSADLLAIDNPAVLYAEWAKFVAWRARGRLDTLIESMAFTDDYEVVADDLEFAIADVRRAAQEMRRQFRDIAHYGD